LTGVWIEKRKTTKKGVRLGSCGERGYNKGEDRGFGEKRELEKAEIICGEKPSNFRRA